MTEATQTPSEFERLANHWDDGTPKTFGNAFTAHMDGAPSLFLTPALEAKHAKAIDLQDSLESTKP